MLDCIIIGGGPAGLAAAQKLYAEDTKNVLLIERDNELGGILNQCIHNGFGLHTFKEELTGPEYAQRYIDELEKIEFPVQMNSMVLNIEVDGSVKKVHVVSKENGYEILETKTIILAMGARERSRFMIQIPGTRPAGVYTAGTAQRYVNMEGFKVGEKVAILGSGDIGLIMARRMSLSGAEVKMVLELEPHSNGLNRNVVQCLDDYNIPLKLSHTVVEIHGKDRLEGVTVARVDENKQVIEDSKEFIECDTLLLSVGLIPENELSSSVDVELDQRTRGPIVNEMMETNVDGIFAAGNVVHIHDLVDNVSHEAAKAAANVAKYIKNESDGSKDIKILPGEFISYTVPQSFYLDSHDEDALEVMFRVTKTAGAIKFIVKDESDNVLIEFRRPVIAPGEMEKVRIPRKFLEGVKESISISVGEV